ncbi:MAG: endonuclease [Bryobacteraceae bacterium]|nr:MAG: endonuclease [Bryobacteraceae bacterium]
MLARVRYGVAAWLLTVMPGYGWGPEGHRLIAEIAWKHATPTARAGIAQLLPEGETLISIAPWADEIRPQRRETAPWHYINIPVEAPQGEWRPYCPGDECIITAIQRFAAQLADRQLPAAAREEALRFLVHFVADLHQPLHCGDRRDRGGNDVPVVFRGRATNLHSIWDTPLLLEALQREGVRERLLRQADPDEFRRAAAGGPEDWVWDSQRASRDTAYAALPPERPALLADEYAALAYPVIEKQIRLGGLRLAALLNRALDPEVRQSGVRQPAQRQGAREQ